MSGLSLTIQYRYREGATWSVQHIFRGIDTALRERYLDIGFRTQLTDGFNNLSAKSSHVLLIINPENNKRIVLSYMDLNRFMLALGEGYQWYPDMIQQAFFTPEHATLVSEPHRFARIGPGHLANCRDIIHRFYPHTYSAYDVHFEDVARSVQVTPDDLRRAPRRLHFRGFLWEPRAEIARATLHNEIHFTDQMLSGGNYINHLTRYRCGLSLNGQGEICNRDMEYLALGVPLFRPLLKHTGFKNSLVPNVHYIAFDYPRQPNSDSYYLGAPNDHNAKLIAAALIERWEEVKNDIEFLEFVGRNGREWYWNNATLQHNIDFFVGGIDLGLLQ